MNETGRNLAVLEGRIHSAPTFSHENHGVRFNRFLLEVPRLSGQSDLLPILAGEHSAFSFAVGEALRLRGQLRSFNNPAPQGSRLILTVHLQAVEPCTHTAENIITLRGTLCKPPVLRRTPLGRCICDLILAVPRRYGRTDYLPVIVWGEQAARAAARTVGDTVALEGRIQSRVYNKVTPGGREERVAYEVSSMRLLEAEDTAL